MDVLSGTKSDHLPALQAREGQTMGVISPPLSGTNHGGDFAPAIADILLAHEPRGAGNHCFSMPRLPGSPCRDDDLRSSCVHNLSCRPPL
jgi:hypothetical protein